MREFQGNGITHNHSIKLSDGVNLVNKNLFFYNSDADLNNLKTKKLADPSNGFVDKLSIKKGNSIYHNGDKHNFIYHINTGFVKTEYSLPNGHHHVAQFNGPGDIFGIDGWADGKHHLDAFAICDGDLYCINIKNLRLAMLNDPELFEILEKLMSRIINNKQDHIFSLGSHNAEQKLAFFLINFRNRFLQKNMQVKSITLPMNREDLKNYLGMTSETLSRSFTFLEKKGFIQVRNKEILFNCTQNLEEILI